MYKLQSDSAFHNRMRLGYDNMQLKPDYHDNRHFSLINNLDMRELNNSKTFDYIKPSPPAYDNFTSYRTVPEKMTPVTVEEAETNPLMFANQSEPVDQPPTKAGKPRKRKRHRKRNRKNRNRKGQHPTNDTVSPLITQLCAISIQSEDSVDGCCFDVYPNSASVILPRIRTRLPSDCDSEDSFIVFGEENVTTSIHPQCRTRFLSDCLSEDSFITFEPIGQIDCTGYIYQSSIDDYEVPIKKVKFASEENLCEVHPMVQWSYAYQKARKGPWEQFALDRMRFRNRVTNLASILDPVLEASHRVRVYKERFERNCADAD